MVEYNPSFLITGPKQVGKSTLCWRFWKHLQNKGTSTGGVITLQRKTRSFFLVRNQKYLSFEASKGEEFIPIGDFHIHKENMEAIKAQIINDLNLEYLFLDEVGLLEIMGKGFFSILERVLARTDGTIVVIRESILDQFLIKFSPKFDYEVITLSRKDFDLILNQMKSK